MIQDAIRSLVNGTSLMQAEAAAVAQEIMDGSATPAQTAAFLVSLRLRGETPAVIAGMAETMRAHSIKVQIKSHDPIVDIVGTGGDSMGTFNISTAAIFVVAACGIKVAKHGNRAASGTVGSADILESNGVKLDLSPEGVAQCVEEVGVGFMYAPAFHPAMRFAGPTRKEIGIRTIFNIIGPLTNPAAAQNQVIGAATEELGQKMAEVLNILGTEHSWVTCGADGMDELTLTRESLVWEVRKGSIRHFQITPEDGGLERCSLQAIQPSESDNHQQMFLLSLREGKSAAKDVVMLNAAAALVVANAQPDLRSGVIAARRAIDSGEALEKLHELANLSQKLS